jgi:alanine racemase
MVGGFLCVREIFLALSGYAFMLIALAVVIDLAYIVENNYIPEVGCVSGLSLLTVDLQALVDNWRLLDEKVGDDCCCASVVKANAYGLGVVPVVKALFTGGCRSFFVATLMEGIELRKAIASKDCAIFVFGGLSYDVSDDASCSSDWQDYFLIPVLFSQEHVVRWLDFSRSKQRSLPSVLKVDIGMHRTGISIKELDQLLEDGSLEALQPRYVMGHFACADEPDHPMNSQQSALFQDSIQKTKALLPNILFSLCNSSGIFLKNAHHYNLVRPGIALYGGAQRGLDASRLQPVVSLSLAIMQKKTVRQGEGVGYGVGYRTTRETRLAIVSGGYADGLLRTLSNIGFGYYCDVKVPIVGKVSMDTVIFDITDVDDDADSVAIDGEIIDSGVVEVLGKHQTIDDLAAAAGTISYEILTSLGHRFERTYIPLSN